MREYPDIPTNLPAPTRAVSFICVRFSDEFKHNIFTSECIHDDLNEFIVIDNTSNLFYPTLGQAINAGISKAKYELLVIIHEDVVLLPAWQALFERALNALEMENPDWLVAGVVGWDDNGTIQGYLNDPYYNQSTWSDGLFAEVTRIDGQLLILRKSRGLFPDPNLPGIHHIGRDLSLEATRRSFKPYILNAPPCIHKYADAQGKLIQTPKDSDKLQLRERLGYLADKACSDEYMANKWPFLSTASLDIIQPGPWASAMVPEFIYSGKSLNPAQKKVLESPIILLAKGGGGSRLLSVLAEDINLFIGNDVNPTGDSREMARSIYRGVIRKYRCPSELQKLKIVPDLQTTAAQMLEQSGWPQIWGFKVPENLFLLPELKAAFPNARYVFFRRDPLATALRGTHMTAQMDNQIGQITLALAYDSVGLTRQQILTDNDAIRLARTTHHQLDMALAFKKQIVESRWLDLKFEDLVAKPEQVLSCLAKFSGKEIQLNNILQAFDSNRATISFTEHSKATIKLVHSILDPIRAELGYH